MEGDDGTFMTCALDKLKEILDKIDKDSLVNILTLSDCEIIDQKKTLKKADEIYNMYYNKFNYIKSNAIRFFSYKEVEPETSALCFFIKFK